MVLGFEILNFITLCFSATIFVTLLITSTISLFENESTAAKRALAGAFILPLPYLFLAFTSFNGINIVKTIAIALPVLAGLILFFPLGKRKIDEDDLPKKKIDERDVMFARNRLIPGTERFEQYYKMKPENRISDDDFRKKPGLMSPKSSLYNPATFASADASFATIAGLHHFVEAEPANTKQEVNPAKTALYLKKWAKKLGALELGITELKPYHFYSHVGRGDDYGKEIINKHKFGIAVTVEMNKEMMSYAPAGPTVMESAQQYVNAGIIALQIADFIRKLGYNARAHIDGKYQVVCPLVARDAGLGEIGRMGLLMTPKLGPRVRIAVITTDIPLICDKRLFNYTMIDFCKKCKKCAEVCPSKAISFDNRINIDGIIRWQINQVKCFSFWCQVGTDCGRCVFACPYSHPDNLLHNFVRFGINNSSIFRSFAARMDDILYGKVPPSQQPPKWMNLK